MFSLPEKLKEFTPYTPITGDYKIRLDANESFIEVDRELIAKAVSGVKLNRYPDPYAVEVILAFSELFGVDPLCVTAGSGSDELIGIIISSLLQKGDKFLCASPDFSMYSFYAKLYELEVAEFLKNADMTLNINELIGYINKNGIKAVAFSNPCNPTSLGIEKNEIMRLVTDTNALIILDEAYMDFWDEKQSLIGEVGGHKNLIVLRTCSKSIAIAGLRLGFAVASREIADVLKAVKPPYNVSSLTQAIGAAILSDRDGYRNNINAVKMNTFWLYNELDKLRIFEKIYDTRTNFIFIKTEKARTIYEYLLGEGIAVRCYEGHLRICAGTASENKSLIKSLKQRGSLW